MAETNLAPSRPRRKLRGGISEGVVHQPVAVAAQDVLSPDPIGDLGGTVLPHLADEQGPGLLRPGGGVNPGHKVIGQLISHIQAPAVRPPPAASGGPPSSHPQK